ncbi:hypothetical protein H8R18_08610 [Nanchangia anserum]|uniref:Pilus assembly protein TadE n=1 Tax=Nanchangia anserum TaxID=2692125 RepID=A0A8I0GCD7_9ACTO|nr:hypothetical protein [Nanchangia anserum]MBD3689575.1 hypothetical protein [Nanchangia anserum]QOX81758.1 hypothetical protein H8R18_08610 [Nanchangia anserum]
MRRAGPESGMVTAEIAVALPAVIAVCVLLVGLAQGGAAKIQACDAARVSVRAAAIGEAAPPPRRGVSVEVVTEGEWVSAYARSSAPLLGDLGGALTCEAHALSETVPAS